MILNKIDKPYYASDNTKLYLPLGMNLPSAVAVYEYALALDPDTFDLEWIQERIKRLVSSGLISERLAVIFGWKFFPAVAIPISGIRTAYEVYLMGKPVMSLYSKRKLEEYVFEHDQTRMGGYWSEDPDLITNFFNAQD